MTEKVLFQTASHYSLQTYLQKQHKSDVTIHCQEFKEWIAEILSMLNHISFFINNNTLKRIIII